jgi:large subunit ribosomal protein L7e
MEVEKGKTKQHVPETVAKKRTRNSKLAESRKRYLANSKQRHQTRRERTIKRAEELHKTYAQQDKDLVSLRRKARTENSFYVPAESKTVLVVRIRGINHLAPHIRKILQLFRLRQIHNATLVRVNRATLNMLKKVEPYVTFGYPTRKLVSDLVYKRGYGKIDKQRIPLTSNEIVSKGLGRHGIHSVEELIHELVTCGPNFKVANNFLWSFKLNSPKGGFNNKRHPFQKGGDWGNREEEINDLVRRML